MSNKKLIMGITAIVLVAAIFIISEKMSNAKPPEHRVKFFPELEERRITAIIIKEGESGIKLEKQNGTWYVAPIGNDTDNDNAETETEAPSEKGDGTATSPQEADLASVQVAVEKIVSMKRSELISDNPSKQASFEIDSASGMSVEVIASGKTAGVLRIGKSGPEWNSNYVRLEGSDEVYLIRGGIKHSLPTAIERWKKKEPPAPDTAEAGGGASAAEFGDNVLISAPE